MNIFFTLIGNTNHILLSNHVVSVQWKRIYRRKNCWNRGKILNGKMGRMEDPRSYSVTSLFLQIATELHHSYDSRRFDTAFTEWLFGCLAGYIRDFWAKFNAEYMYINHIYHIQFCPKNADTVNAVSNRRYSFVLICRSSDVTDVGPRFFDSSHFAINFSSILALFVHCTLTTWLKKSIWLIFPINMWRWSSTRIRDFMLTIIACVRACVVHTQCVQWHTLHWGVVLNADNRRDQATTLGLLGLVKKKSHEHYLWISREQFKKYLEC
jgi:hypothetical protein